MKIHNLKEEKYLQIDDATEDEIKDIWKGILFANSGFEVFFTYNSERKQIKVPYEYLKEIGTTMVDDTVIYKLKSKDFKPTNILPYTAELVDYINFTEFANIHDKKHPNMYWTSERIRQRLNLFEIYILRIENEITGYIITMLGKTYNEVMICDAVYTDDFKILIETICKEKNEVIYMIDVKERDRFATLENMGFKMTGVYTGFKIKI
ncbi:MAG: hypothetical protein FWF57_01285 [Defluviitaleaceae bacterium]|nr:hypothetical protein [Defluviitaleaceae bacterium]